MIQGLRQAVSFAWNWRGGATALRAHEPTIDRGDRQVEASLYLPGAPNEGLPGWVVLHGITRPGRHHPTLLHFVRTLAGTGASVLVPEIPEWRELYLAPDEAEATIRASVAYLAERAEVDARRIGIIGFSLGVPQVLQAATDPTLQESIRGVAGFGGYGHLDRTIAFLFHGEHEWQGTIHRVEPDPYGRWIVGGNYLTLVPGYEDAGDVAEALLELARQGGDSGIGSWEPRFDPVKRDLLKGIHPSRRTLFRAFAPPAGEFPPREVGEILAPALAQAAREAAPQSEPRSLLNRIKVPVRLVHGRGDRLIPFSESLRLAEAFPARADVRVYLTNLFSHSHAETEGAGAGDVGEQLHFLRILTDLLTLVD